MSTNVGTEDGCTTERAGKRRLATLGIALAILAVTAWVPRSTYAGESSTGPVDQCEQFSCQG